MLLRKIILFHKVRYKAKFAAKGYVPQEGIDYNKVFSPVTNHSYIRILLTLIAQFDLKLVQMDIKTVFSHGDLKMNIYICMTRLYGFMVGGKEDRSGS